MLLDVLERKLKEMPQVATTEKDDFEDFLNQELDSEVTACDDQIPDEVLKTVWKKYQDEKSSSEPNAEKEEAAATEKKKERSPANAPTVWGKYPPICNKHEIKRILKSIVTKRNLMMGERERQYVAQIGNELCVGIVRKAAEVAKTEKVTSNHIFMACEHSEFSFLYHDVGAAMFNSA